MTELDKWKFGGSVPQIFEDHIKKSVPFYHEAHDLGICMSDFFVANGARILDLGCSTGKFCNMIAKRHRDIGAQIIGIDIDKDMVSYAMSTYKRENLEFLCGDYMEIEAKNTSLFCSFYTLQFIHPSKRQQFVEKIYKDLEWGGALILFEKVRAPDARFQDYMMQLYNNFKLKSFTPEEIYRKSEQLKGVLEPFSTDGNLGLLRRAGFTDIMTIYKYLCFEGFLAIK